MDLPCTCFEGTPEYIQDKRSQETQRAGGRGLCTGRCRLPSDKAGGSKRLRCVVTTGDERSEVRGHHGASTTHERFFLLPCSGGRSHRVNPPPQHGAPEQKHATAQHSDAHDRSSLTRLFGVSPLHS
ncbi:unnamed protein product, partial [Ectocarpus sp. 12 AP-2014]